MVGRSKRPSNQPLPLTVAFGLAWHRVGLFHLSCSACMYVNDRPSPSRHADDTVVIATYSQPALLIKYRETYFSDLDRWLSERSNAINVSKSSAMLFAKPEQIQWVDSTRYLRVTPDRRLTWWTHINQVRKKGLRVWEHSIRNGLLLYKQLIRPMVDYVCRLEVRRLLPY
jgi:hypothetical protein